MSGDSNPLAEQLNIGPETILGLFALALRDNRPAQKPRQDEPVVPPNSFLP